MQEPTDALASPMRQTRTRNDSFLLRPSTISAFVLLLPCPYLAAQDAKAVTAASCSFESVREALAQAPAGSTLNVPAGDCDWGSNQLTIGKSIHLRGQGKTATTIRSNGNVASEKHLITFDCSSAARPQISDMTLMGNRNGSVQDKGLGLTNTCVDFKVWNMRITNFTFAGIEVQGDSATQRGVIFQSDFIDNYSPTLRNLGYAIVVFGNGAWPALELGTANAVFAEDNFMRGNRHSIASNNGARYVFRYNTVVGDTPTKDFPLVDAHGPDYHPRGTRQFEIYENRIMSTDSSERPSTLVRSAINVRGGTGVIFNNRIEKGISRSVELDVTGASCGTYPAQDQLQDLHIWNNTPHDEYGYTDRGVANNCPATIGMNRDYFLAPKSGYRPFPFPHALRCNGEKTCAGG